jgi:hypothetical protein
MIFNFLKAIYLWVAFKFFIAYSRVKLLLRGIKMALKLEQLDGQLSVICRLDSSLDCSEEDYKNYLESGLNEAFLKFKEGDAPTKFVLRKTLPWGLAKKVEDEKVAMNKGEVQIKMSFMVEEVRCSLVDIVNPPHVPEAEQIKYLRASDGGASERLMEKLMALGIVQDLYTAKKAATEKNSLLKDDLKKS